MNPPKPLARTSASHPLQIATLQPPGWAGRLGITFCPGKQGDSVFGAPWQRDLATDLDAIVAWGGRLVVTLVEPRELHALGVPALGAQVQARGMAWVHAPIPDLHPPGPAFMRGWPRLVEQVAQVADAGGGVLVHCRGGLGRAGTVAACILVTAGMAAPAAVVAVREVRPGAIETAAQEEFVRRFDPQGAGGRR